MSEAPIDEYALLSDCHTAALVHRSGSIDWMCMPRFDSPAVFCRLLDDRAGHWHIRPTEAAEVTREYVDGSLVLETRFECAGGHVILRDALAVGANESGHELGAGSPHALLREVRCTSGAVEFEIEYAPRPEYGLTVPLLRGVGGGVLGRGGAAVVLLSSPVDLQVDDGDARGTFALGEGERACFALQYASSSQPEPEHWAQADIAARLDQTVHAWRTWAQMHQAYEGPWAAEVRHSGRVLQGLTYFPTGAIVAAPTTSLPEDVGGERNWDYRYTWVRDASFTLDALWVAACPDEAHKFFDFLANAALTRLRRGDDMQIMYGIGGEHRLVESHLDHLSGWRKSAPVRVGNGAWTQRQVDVYGELLAAVERLRDQLDDLEEVTRSFLVEVADTAAARWGDRDHGIWEIRAEPRHYLHSKLMCWVALDRAIELEDLLDAADKVDQWTSTRAEIREAIIERGWSEAAGAFTQSFGDDALDAAALVVPIVGFLPPDDSRVLATIEAIEEQLTDERGLVYRYRTEDGLAGEEGTFLLCTFWLARALALAGRPERAREVFERAVAFTNDVGLMAEEVEPESGELMGNFPQAFSHIGLVNAAWAIHEAEQEASR